MSPDPDLPIPIPIPIPLPRPADRGGWPAEPLLVATFAYELPEDRWSWTPVSGVDADDLCSSVAIFGEDGDGAAREHLEGIVAAALAGGPMVYRGTVTDPDGYDRDVLVLGESDGEDAGPLTGLRGFVFDLVTPRPTGAEDEVFELRIECDLLWQALRDADVTGQAKGVIMASCGCSADVASDVLDELVHRSGLTAREVAEWLIHSTCTGQGTLADALATLGLDRDR